MVHQAPSQGAFDLDIRRFRGFDSRCAQLAPWSAPPPCRATAGIWGGMYGVYALLVKAVDSMIEYEMLTAALYAGCLCLLSYKAVRAFFFVPTGRVPISWDALIKEIGRWRAVAIVVISALYFISGFWLQDLATTTDEASDNSANYAEDAPPPIPTPAPPAPSPQFSAPPRPVIPTVTQQSLPSRLLPSVCIPGLTAYVIHPAIVSVAKNGTMLPNAQARIGDKVIMKVISMDKCIANYCPSENEHDCYTIGINTSDIASELTPQNITAFCKSVAANDAQARRCREYLASKLR